MRELSAPCSTAAPRHVQRGHILPTASADCGCPSPRLYNVRTHVAFSRIVRSNLLYKLLAPRRTGHGLSVSPRASAFAPLSSSCQRTLIVKSALAAYCAGALALRNFIVERRGVEPPPGLLNHAHRCAFPPLVSAARHGRRRDTLLHSSNKNIIKPMNLPKLPAARLRSRDVVSFLRVTEDALPLFGGA